MSLTLVDLAAKIPAMIGETAGTMLGNAPDLLFSAKKADSLSEFASVARYSPPVIVDGLIAKDPIITDILKVVNQLSSVYYLQALSLMMKHDDTHIADILDSLNPNRKFGAADIRKKFVGGNASYDGHALPVFDIEKNMAKTATSPFDYSVVPGNEAGFNLKQSVNVAAGKALENIENSLKSEPIANKNFGNTQTSLHKDTMNTISTIDNLVVGKVVDVVFKSSKGETSIPIQFIVRPIHAPSRSLVDILSHAEKDISLNERLWEYKNDLISFGDLVTCADILDDHRKALRRDTTGIYATMLKRKKGATFSGFLHAIGILLKGGRDDSRMGAAVAVASYAYVLDKSTAEALEYAVGGKLSDFRLRSRIFANSLAQMMFVVDTAWNSVTIYHRGEEQASTLSSGDLKSSGGKGGSGTDMLAMLESFNKGSIYNQSRF